MFVISLQVLAWLRRKGEETLKRHKTLAETLNAIREQENEFEKFYFLAMVIIIYFSKTNNRP